jgi:hypothetical protein
LSLDFRGRLPSLIAGGIRVTTKPQAPLIDYYAVMNLPYDADLTGVANAYARLSDELATLGRVDNGASEALKKLNEAYSVLSRPEKRSRYDAVFLADYQRQKQEIALKAERKTNSAQWIIIGVVLAILGVQGAALAYIGRDDLANIFPGLF